jgi:hypothetical protein
MLLSDNISDILPDQFSIAVALGKVPGWRAFRKFGMNDDVDGNEWMWPLGTARTLPSAAAVVSIVSDDINDDGDPESTGAFEVTVEGLDANYNEIEETVTLNGVGAVTTTASFLRVNSAYCPNAGTSGHNEGNITLSISGNAQAYIEATEGQTHQTFYTVPAGHTFVVTYFTVFAGRLGASDLAVHSQIKLDGTTGWRTISDIFVYEGQYMNPQGATVIPQKTEIRQSIVSNATNAECGSVFSGYLIDNNYL